MIKFLSYKYVMTQNDLIWNTFLEAMNKDVKSKYSFIEVNGNLELFIKRILSFDFYVFC